LEWALLSRDNAEMKRQRKRAGESEKSGEHAAIVRAGTTVSSLGTPEPVEEVEEH